jgi:hypothetical protein
VIGSEIMIHCVVRDVSAGGAKKAICKHVPLPDAFDLFIAAQDLRVYFAGVSSSCPKTMICRSRVPHCARSQRDHIQR